MVIASEQATSYLFGFDEKGILLENTINITTNEMNVSLKINKVVAGNPWVKENIKKLDDEIIEELNRNIITKYIDKIIVYEEEKVDVILKYERELVK